MRKFWSAAGLAIGVVLLTPASAWAAPPAASHQLKVTASVRAYTYIIIDDSVDIVKIYNNSDFLADKVVLKQSLNGSQSPLSKRVNRQFNQLQEQRNLNGYGMVYDRDALPAKALAPLSSLAEIYQSFSW